MLRCQMVKKSIFLTIRRGPAPEGRGTGERVPHNLMRVMPPKEALMNANPKFLAATAHVDEAAIKPLPNSRKVHVEGSRPDIRVPMREITQADTPSMFGGEQNPPVFVYDCSGPYT